MQQIKIDSDYKTIKNSNPVPLMSKRDSINQNNYKNELDEVQNSIPEKKTDYNNKMQEINI